MNLPIAGAAGTLVLLLHSSAGAQNHGIFLNGIDAYGTASSGSIQVPSTTWEAWVRVPELDPAHDYFGNVLSRWGMWTHYSPNVNVATGQVTGACGFGPCGEGSAFITPGDWHHLAVVLGPSASPSWTLYVDGVPAETQGPGTQVPTATWEIILGAHNYLGYKAFLRAEVDEVRISSTPRYSGPFVPSLALHKDPHTIGLWHFDEGAGSVVQDSSGNGHHFQLHGGYSWVPGVVIDCNGNGVNDLEEIASGAGADCNHNLRLDACEINDDPLLDVDGDGNLDECVHPGLHADVYTVSASSGGRQSLSISSGPQPKWNAYLIVGSASGTAPGFALDGFPVPLNSDEYLFQTVACANTGPFEQTLGVLAPDGLGSARIAIPAGLHPSLAGLQLHHVAVAWDLSTTPGSPFANFVSNPVPLTLAP